MSTFDDNVEPSDDLLDRVSQWFLRGDLSEYVRLHEGQIEYRWELPLEMGRADFEMLMACCLDNIVEVDGEDVIDFDAVRADFEAAKKAVGARDVGRQGRRSSPVQGRPETGTWRQHRVSGRPRI